MVQSIQKCVSIKSDQDQRGDLLNEYGIENTKHARADGLSSMRSKPITSMTFRTEGDPYPF